MAISSEQIVQVAINILNRDGIEKLTMRTLAKELDIKAASLYWHIKNKQDLYGLLAESICARIQFKDTSNIKSSIILLCEKYRSSLLEVRDSVAVFEESLPNTPKRMELIKIVYQLIRERGVSDSNLLTAANMLNNYVLSFTDDEMRLRRYNAEEAGLDENLLGQGLSQTPIHIDSQFIYGIEVLLAGFKAMEKKSL
jgi:AcrR family transcriptional regulator